MAPRSSEKVVAPGRQKTPDRRYACSEALVGGALGGTRTPNLLIRRPPRSSSAYSPALLRPTALVRERPRQSVPVAPNAAPTPRACGSHLVARPDAPLSPSEWIAQAAIPTATVKHPTCCCRQIPARGNVDWSKPVRLEMRMALRRYFVRRFVNNSDRVVVLPDTGGPPSPRRGDYDDYDHTRTEAEPEPPTLDERHIPDATRTVCPECGRAVRFNQRSQSYYSHSKPGSTEICPRSGRW